MVYNFLDKKSKGSGAATAANSLNQYLANELKK